MMRRKRPLSVGRLGLCCLPITLIVPMVAKVSGPALLLIVGGLIATSSWAIAAMLGDESTDDRP